MSRPSSYNRPWGHGADPDQMGGESASADQSVITAGWVGRVNAAPPTARMQNYWQARVDLGLQEIERQGFLSWRVDVPYTVGAMVSYAGNFFQALSANSGIAPQGSKDVGIWSLIRPGKWPTSTDSITGVLQVDKGGTGRRNGIHWMHVLNRPKHRDGYGIIDVPTKDEVDTALIKKADKATTLAGYGITDGMTAAQVNVAIAGKANKATTLAGYGITDGMTAAQVNAAVSNKADRAETLAGYGIADGVTAREMRSAIAGFAPRYTVPNMPSQPAWQVLGGLGVIPPGGTWAYFELDINPNTGGVLVCTAGVLPGGTRTSANGNGLGFAWRIQ